MPSEVNEPALEELSAYLDHELDTDAQARVAAHIAGCQDCQARLDGLRQTTYAVRALPMETPPRAFTIPAQRRRSFRWAPVGWVGGFAAALLVIVVGVTQLHLPGGAPSSAGTALQYSNGSTSQSKSTEHGAAAPGVSALDRTAQGATAARANQVTVVHPRIPSRTLTLSTDAGSYRPNGTMTVTVVITGGSADNLQTVALMLVRQGYGVELPTPARSVPSADVGLYEASYSLSNLALPSPPAGNYTLIVITRMPDGAPAGSGQDLVAQLPITIGG